MQYLTLITAIAGLVFGVVGAVLGIINTWRAFDRERVRLKVSPVWYFRSDGVQTAHTLGVEITNLSFFPVTISSVGFKLSDGQMFTFLTSLPSGGYLPQRMESRTSLTAVAPLRTENNPAMKDVISAYAQTACGCVFMGDSPALRGVVNEARSAGTGKEANKHEG
jgi:hypothetical protein